MSRLRVISAAALAVIAVAAAPASAAGSASVEVVVTLPLPALADAPQTAFAHDGAHMDVATAGAQAYLAKVDGAQKAFVARLHAAIPSAQVRWRYRLVLDAVAVVVPNGSLAKLSQLSGIVRVDASTRYGATLDRSVPLIGAPTLWGPTLSSAGQGMKIAIVDDGLDSSHPFFAPAGYAYPPGFPKGDTRYTTPKVIVARTFPAPGRAVHADVPFDPENSEHATHVSGIAAGDDGTHAAFDGGSAIVSGVAPRAYLGNYKVMSVPTPAVGIDGNSPEIAAAIESAVADGMDVINLSLGEPEVQLSRDLVVRALDGAAKLGVVPVVAAGNDYNSYGEGSVGSPGTAPSAITVAASGTGRTLGLDEIADFSSGGPTPISLQLKPDVAAPGAGILSSLPARDGLWAAWDGTSMAAPHVSGAVALLLQRHPAWTVAQVKSALVLTGHAVTNGSGQEVPPLREGGGRIDVVAADAPLVFAAPTSVSFGLVRPGRQVTREIGLTDAGGGAGTWSVALQLTGTVSGVTVTVPTSTTAPGAFMLSARIAANAAEGDEDGFVVLRNLDGATRRIPFWLHVEKPRLGTEAHRTLARPGLYAGTTKGKPARVSTYRYPVRFGGPPSMQSFPGPEQVFRFRVNGRVANAGVVVTSTAGGASVVPHVVVAGDENRMTGYAGLPQNIDPYQGQLGAQVPAAAVDLPGAGQYDAVFDTPRGGRPGAFRFRFWVDDTTPPAITLLTPKVRAGHETRLRIVDRGSGVDPAGVTVTANGSMIPHAFAPATGTLTVDTTALRTGSYKLVVTASDYQESKNMESTGPVLPNTRVLRTTVTVA